MQAEPRQARCSGSNSTGGGGAARCGEAVESHAAVLRLGHRLEQHRAGRQRKHAPPRRVRSAPAATPGPESPGPAATRSSTAPLPDAAGSRCRGLAFGMPRRGRWPLSTLGAVFTGSSGNRAEIRCASFTGLVGCGEREPHGGR
jgi:hypothetical protein